MRRQQEGFTLIEILVAVLIITILATYVGVKLAHQPGQARAAATRAQIVTFRTAINLYRLNHGAIPTPAQGLEALCRRPASPPVPENYPPGGYLESPNLPLDPCGSPYVYLVPGPKGMAYDILSYGADREPGGEGDNADILLSEM